MIITLCISLMICLASCLHAGDFLPKYVPENGNCYQYASKVYSSSPRPDQGVYECGDTIFVVVVLDATSIKKRHLEGKAMLRSIALLRGRMPDLPAKFTTGNRLVEKSLDDEKMIYHYALAYRKSALYDAIKLAKEQEKKSREIAKMKQDVSKEKIKDNTSFQEGSEISGKEKKAPMDTMPSSDAKHKEEEKSKNVEESKVGSSKEGSAIVGKEKNPPVGTMPSSDAKHKEEEKPKNVEESKVGSSKEGAAISGKEMNPPMGTKPSSDAKNKEEEKPKNVEESKVGSSKEGSAISGKEKNPPVGTMPSSDAKHKEEEKPKNVEKSKISSSIIDASEGSTKAESTTVAAAPNTPKVPRKTDDGSFIDAQFLFDLEE